MNIRQCVHLWAQQSRREGTSGNVYFISDTIYSYGRHFPIARFATPDVVLFTSHGYSNSTSKHKSWAHQAVCHRRVYVVDNVRATTKAEHLANFVHLRTEIEAALVNLYRKRDKPTAIRYIQDLTAKANAYAAEFRLRQRVKLNEDFAEAAKQVKAAIIARDAVAARKQRSEVAKRAVELANELAEWRFGARHYLNTADGRVHLRIVGETVQTSQGAEFPISHCQRVWKFISRVRARGTDWHKNGECCPVGLFQVDSIDGDGNVVAGCHNIEFGEIERIAYLLELTAE